jgi:group I intron endonuclease
MAYFIYCIENIINHKKYIGQTSKTIEERFCAHKKCMIRRKNQVLYDAMNKYGIDNFIIYQVEECNKENCSEKEQYWIKQYNTTNRDFGYNMTGGGEKCNKLEGWSEENKKELYKKQAMKRKKSAQKLGVEHFNQLPENRVKLGKHLKGKTFEEVYGKDRSDAIKLKISRTLKNIGHKPPIHHGGNHGYHLTNEDKQKMSVARRGKTYEEIYGITTAKVMKDKKVEVSLKRQFNIKKESLKIRIKVLDYLSNNKGVSYKDIPVGKASIHNIRTLLREIGIDNYQFFKYNFLGNDKDWWEFFQSKILFLRSKYAE